MNVASLELCKELYELSGWKDTYHYHYLEHQNRLSNGDFDTVPTMMVDKRYRAGTSPKDDFIPAYDLGYLLRKLPHKIGTPKYHQKYIRYSNDDGKSYNFGYMLRDLIINPSFTADTPENAACKLAIELFKQGILKK